MEDCCGCEKFLLSFSVFNNNISRLIKTVFFEKLWPVLRIQGVRLFDSWLMTLVCGDISWSIKCSNNVYQDSISSAMSKHYKIECLNNSDFNLNILLRQGPDSKFGINLPISRASFSIFNQSYQLCQVWGDGLAQRLSNDYCKTINPNWYQNWCAKRMSHSIDNVRSALCVVELC